MRLLVVEDDPRLGEQIVQALSEAGHVVERAEDGRDALHMGEQESFDAVVLDLGLPGMDGLSVLTRWRQNGRAMPVLILTARDAWHEKVAGIDAGADDYLAKPFHMEELLARLRALMRRAHGLATPTLQWGEVSLDTRSGRVTRDGQPLTLTSHEYKLLAYLMHRPGEIVSRGELIEHLYAQDFERDSNTIEVFIARLRKKLPADMIATVRGLGYRLAPPPR